MTVSASEIEISWSPPIDMDRVIEYRVYYHNADKSHAEGQLLDKSVTKYKLTRLIPNTVYSIELTAFSSIDPFAEDSTTIQQRTKEFSKKIFISVSLR